MVKPEAVIEHEAKETLLRALSRIAVAADAAAVFASDVAGQRESRLAEKILRPVQILDLDTVIAVVPDTAVDSQRLFTQGILIPEDRKPSIRPPQELQPKSRPTVKSTVRLPSVGEPRLDLQVFCRENLHAHAVEEPWRIRRNVGRLIRPVVELVVTEKPDVGHEDPRIHVDSMQGVEVVAAVGLRNIAVRIVQLPLTARWAGVITRRRLRIHTKLRHQPGAHVVVVKIAAYTELRHLHFVVPEDLARSTNRVVFRMIETVVVIHVGPDLWGKKLRGIRRVYGARIAVQPCEIGKGKG